MPGRSGICSSPRWGKQRELNQLARLSFELLILYHGDIVIPAKDKDLDEEMGALSCAASGSCIKTGEIGEMLVSGPPEQC